MVSYHRSFFTAFPTETFHHILQEVSLMPYGGRTLFKCAQVSRTFAEISLPLLYSEITIKSIREAKRLGEAPRLPYNIRSLTVHLSLNSAQWEAILPKCDGLLELHLCGLQIKTPRTILFHPSLANLQTLTLEHEIDWQQGTFLHPTYSAKVPFSLHSLFATGKVTHFGVIKRIADASATTLTSLEIRGRHPLLHFGSHLEARDLDILIQLVQSSTTLASLSISCVSRSFDPFLTLKEEYVRKVLESTSVTLEDLELEFETIYFTPTLLDTVSEALRRLTLVETLKIQSVAAEELERLAGWKSFTESMGFKTFIIADADNGKSISFDER